MSGLSEEELGAVLGSDPDLDGVDLVAGVRAALEVPAAPRPRLRLVAWGGPPALLLAAAIALVVVQRQSDDEGFRAKGAAATSSAAGVRVFRDGPEGRVEVATSIPRQAALSFAYSNTGAAPFSHLMVFAVDEARRVFWYWPAWTDAAADPSALRAVPVAVGRDLELAEEVRHELTPGTLTLYTLLLPRTATVAEIERAVARGDAPPFGLGDEVRWQAQLLEVTP